MNSEGAFFELKKVCQQLVGESSEPVHVTLKSNVKVLVDTLRKYYPNCRITITIDEVTQQIDVDIVPNSGYEISNNATVTTKEIDDAAENV